MNDHSNSGGASPFVFVGIAAIAVVLLLLAALGLLFFAAAPQAVVPAPIPAQQTMPVADEADDLTMPLPDLITPESPTDKSAEELRSEKAELEAHRERLKAEIERRKAAAEEE